MDTRSTTRSKKCEEELATVAETTVKEHNTTFTQGKAAASPPRTICGSVKSKKSSVSSFHACKRRLELQAQAEKAKIRMELIDLKLQADLVELQEGYSPHEEDEVSVTSNVAEWLETSHEELKKARPTHDYGTTEGVSMLPSAPAPASAALAAQSTVPVRPPPQPAAPPPPAAAPPPAALSADGTIHMLASALKDLATASVNNEHNATLLSRISTPKDLPEFAGDPMEWLQFKQAYDESTLLCNFSEKENLWRLRKCLRGAAKETVAALLISATSPATIMATLQLRYGNPDGIVSRLLQDIKKLQPMAQEYQRDIIPFSIKVQNFMEAVRALDRQEYLLGMNTVSLILSKLPAVLIAKWSDYSFPLIQEGTKPRLIILSEFLSNEALKISITASIHFTSATSSHRPHVAHVLHTEHDTKCHFCRTATHKLTACKKFARSLRKVRWQYVKRNGICYKCLNSRHSRETCPAPACDQDSCGQTHHRLLHYPVNNRRDESASVIVQSPPEPELPTQTVTNIDASECRVLLKVVPIRVHGPNGVIDTTALLDDGSTVSLLSSALAERAGLRGRRQTMRVSGAWADTQMVCETTVVDVNLSGMDNKVHSIKARSIHELNLPIQNLSVVNCNSYQHLLDVKDYLCTSDTKPEMLIGQDNYHLLLPLEIKLGKPNEPSATLTPLGWCLHGRVSEPRPCEQCEHSLVIYTDTPRDEQMPQNDLGEVKLPFTSNSMVQLGKPRQNVDVKRAGRKRKGTSQLVSKGVARKFKLRGSQRTPHTWFSPHSHVGKTNKETRLVVDAPARVNGMCSNNNFLAGPDSLSSLYGNMLLYRENKIAVTGDIKIAV
ncbi:uncharacterized protein LOC126370802 [Pectinophora gossypiella]|nr:uncharacterized protein LOC126370802 [Pectinophora gossypiella]